MSMRESVCVCVGKENMMCFIVFMCDTLISLVDDLKTKQPIKRYYILVRIDFRC